MRELPTTGMAGENNTSQPRIPFSIRQMLEDLVNLDMQKKTDGEKKD